MLAAIVLAALITAVAARNAGPKFVTHERAPDHQHASSFAVSPSLTRLVADRRLFAVAERVYWPRPRCSPPAVLVALLLLLGGVEINPGPSTGISSASRDALSLGVLNVRSAQHKGAVIRDVVDENRLDVLAMTETWIPSDAPNAVKLDVAPSNYQVLHRHRGSSADRRGGGVAIVHRDAIKATAIDVGDYTEFESLAVRLVGRQSQSVVVVCVYRPPGAVTAAFTDQLSDMLDHLALLDTRYVVVGDFNVPGDAAGQLDRHAVDVFFQHGLHQRVSSPTHKSGNTLDLILSHGRICSCRRRCAVGLLFRSSPADLSSGCASAAASHEDVQLSTGPPNRYRSVPCRCAALQTVRWLRKRRGRLR